MNDHRGILHQRFLQGKLARQEVLPLATRDAEPRRPSIPKGDIPSHHGHQRDGVASSELHDRDGLSAFANHLLELTRRSGGKQIARREGRRNLAGEECNGMGRGMRDHGPICERCTDETRGLRTHPFKHPALSRTSDEAHHSGQRHSGADGIRLPATTYVITQVKTVTYVITEVKAFHLRNYANTFV